MSIKKCRLYCKLEADIHIVRMFIALEFYQQFL